MEYSHDFELFPNEKIVVEAYKSLKGANLVQICQKFKEKNIHAAFLNPHLIISLKQILVAMNKALYRKSTYQGKGKFEVIKEFINALTPEKVPKGVEFNFYLKDNYGPGILILQCAKDTPVNIKEVFHADPEMFEDIGCYANFDLLRKLYSIEDVELNLETDLRGSIYNQICLKNLKAGKQSAESNV